MVLWEIWLSVCYAKTVIQDLKDNPVYTVNMQIVYGCDKSTHAHTHDRFMALLDFVRLSWHQGKTRKVKTVCIYWSKR